VAVGSDREGIWISVADQGIGIAPQDVDRIFERFVQLESSSTRRFQGTGIGLSIVKQLVTLHGGRIVVDSEPGRGTTFIVHLAALPRITVAAASATEPELPKSRLQPAPSTHVEPVGTAGPLLAVVEDNPELLAYLAQELGRWYRVSPFADSTAAVQAIVAEPPDLIVSDIMMPGLDGIELARKVRANARTTEVPVILLSAREEVESKVAGFEAGADDYVHKPFDLQELHARIELHLRLRAQASKIREALEQLKRAETSLVQNEKMVALGRMVAGVAHEMKQPHPLPARKHRAAAQAHGCGAGGRGDDGGHRREPGEDHRSHPPAAALRSQGERQYVGRGEALRGGAAGAQDDGAADTQRRSHCPGDRRRNGAGQPAGPVQVILNIVHNALQAVDPQTGEVRIAARTNGERVELSVADNGCGISKENLSRIFDPFFTTKPPGSGTGLGLSIVQELVAAQQGTVRVESEPGRGTTVAVSLQAVHT